MREPNGRAAIESELVPERRGQEAAAVGVREMTPGGEDAPLEPSRIRAGFERRDVVVRLDDDEITAWQEIAPLFAGAPEVGGHHDAASGTGDAEGARFRCIVTDGERGHREAADPHRVAYGDLVESARGEADRGGGAAGGDEGHRPSLEPRARSYVIDMLVGEQDGGQIRHRMASLTQAGFEETRADATVDEEDGAALLDQQCVSGTAAAQAGDGEHESLLQG